MELQSVLWPVTVRNTFLELSEESPNSTSSRVCHVKTGPAGLSAHTLFEAAAENDAQYQAEPHPASPGQAEVALLGDTEDDECHFSIPTIKTYDYFVDESPRNLSLSVGGGRGHGPAAPTVAPAAAAAAAAPHGLTYAESAPGQQEVPAYVRGFSRPPYGLSVQEAPSQRQGNPCLSQTSAAESMADGPGPSEGTSAGAEAAPQPLKVRMAKELPAGSSRRQRTDGSAEKARVDQFCEAAGEPGAAAGQAWYPTPGMCMQAPLPLGMMPPYFAGYHPMAPLWLHLPGGEGMQLCAAGTLSRPAPPSNPLSASGIRMANDSSRRKKKDWTSVVLQNLPLNYRRPLLLSMLDAEGFAGAYDFVYLPMDFKTRAGFGYAFVNLVDPSVVPRFWAAFDGYKKWVFPSAKVCQVNWSVPCQGQKAQISRYRNSHLMHQSVPDEYRPVIFSGGVRVPFPPPTRELAAPSQRALPKAPKESKQQGST